MQYESQKTGKIYSGETKQDLYIDMIERGGMTYAEVGRVFSITRSAVWHELKNLSDAMLQRLKLREGYTTELLGHVPDIIDGKKTVDEVAELFDTNNKRTIRFLKRALPKPERKATSENKRLRNMVWSIWGKDFEPGAKFGKWVERKLRLVDNDRYTEFLVQYYIDQKNNDRIIRGNALRKLGSIIRDTYKIDGLIEKDIIRNV